MLQLLVSNCAPGKWGVSDKVAGEPVQPCAVRCACEDLAPPPHGPAGTCVFPHGCLTRLASDESVDESLDDSGGVGFSRLSENENRPTPAPPASEQEVLHEAALVCSALSVLLQVLLLT